ncbi:MAG: hypothetical protein HYR85_01600 [Planctomycetes bacterium]|nr:hypothetical protein [Planctomycetota bacterium]MBI3845961.1 hypothetical protein [Planctomycetota bacterium]
MTYDDEKKWCPKCRRYVKYLQSYNSSYCSVCGEKVLLFNDEDWAKFKKSLQKPDGSAPPGAMPKQPPSDSTTGAR